VRGKTIIGVTGMPGAGKDTVREVFRKLGFPIVIMGDEVRAEAERRGLPPTPENLGKIMLQLRAEEGPEVLARRCLTKIKGIGSKVVIIEGIRSLDEVAAFKKDYPHVRIIAVHASPQMRYERLVKRNRSDDPKDWKTFIERDQRELSVGLGNVIATADIMVINESTFEDFKQELRQLLNREFGV
jgi:dephospho-CoA kinase